MTLRLLKTYHEIFVYTIFQIYDKFNRLLNGIIKHTIGAGFNNNSSVACFFKLYTLVAIFHHIVTGCVYQASK